MVSHEVLNSDIKLGSRGLAIDAHVGALQNPTDIFLEQLTSWALQLCGEEEFISAKEAFFESTGKVFYDDEMYHSRMHYFI